MKLTSEKYSTVYHSIFLHNLQRLVERENDRVNTKSWASFWSRCINTIGIGGGRRLTCIALGVWVCGGIRRNFEKGGRLTRQCKVQYGCRQLIVMLSLFLCAIEANHHFKVVRCAFPSEHTYDVDLPLLTNSSSRSFFSHDSRLTTPTVAFHIPVWDSRYTVPPF